MKRLRHPIRAIHEPFGKAGLIVAIFALVFAMLGGAYAATGGSGHDPVAIASKKKKSKKKSKSNAALTGKQQKEVEKIAKKYAGKPGAAGPAGPAGPAGAAGPKGDTGSKGDAGAAGTNGTDGTNGTNGNTVLNGTAVPATSLGNVGDFYIRTSTSEIYGPKSAAGWGSPTPLKGAKGEPWTPNNTLPVNATETGVWGLSTEQHNFPFTMPISFPVQLTAALGASNVAIKPAGYNGEDGVGAEHEQCPGSVTNPKAKSGNLCVYTKFQLSVVSVAIQSAVTGTSGAGTTGALLKATIESTASFAVAEGTWAVTG